MLLSKAFHRLIISGEDKTAIFFDIFGKSKRFTFFRVNFDVFYVGIRLYGVFFLDERGFVLDTNCSCGCSVA